MKVLEFGDPKKRKIILIHGFQMPYQIWNQYINYYKNDFCIVVPIMPGHYPNHGEDFLSFFKTAQDFEDYYISHFGKDVYAIFAMSMGGVLAVKLWQNGRLNIQKIIFDGSPLIHVNGFIEKMILKFYLDVTHRSQERDRKTLDQAKKLVPKAYLDDFLQVLDAMTDTTIKNCIKGVVHFQLPDYLDHQNTKIFYFHGTKMNEFIAKKSANFIAKHYKHAYIKCFKGKSHCETTLFFPQVMFEELDRILV